MPATHPVLLLLLGEAPDEVRARHDGYVAWFERAWGGPLLARDGRAGGPAIDPRAFAGIVITGSPDSLVAPTGWMEEAADLVRRAAGVGTPVLGVCFGHQLIAHAFGGRVIRNPRGWEIGTHPVTIDETGLRDPLFDGVEPTFLANLTHEDIVDGDSLAGGPVRVLARSALTDVQALAVGDHVRGVQFHPEISGPVCRAYIEARRHLLAPLDADALLRQTVEAPATVAILRNFRRRFVDGAAGR